MKATLRPLVAALDRRRRRAPSTLAWLVLLVGGLASLVAAERWRSVKEAETRQRFEVSAADGTAAVSEELRRYEDALRSASGLFAASEQVERAEFRAFVRSLSLADRFAGARGLVFLTRVARQRRRRFEALMRADGAPRFAILPPPRASASFPITYAEPVGESRLGLDLRTVAATRRSLERARDSGRPVLTKRVGQDRPGRDKAKEFILFVPVYRKKAARLSAGERRAALLGWLGAPFDGSELVAGALERHRDVAVRAYDTAGTGRNPLIGAVGRLDPSALTATRSLGAYGRPWSLRFSALPNLANRSDSREPLLVLAAALALTLTLFALVWTLTRSKARALTLVDEATEELAHQALHDPLTGLPNRALFLDRAGLALAQSRRDEGTPAVMFLDLDRFKLINDSLGHECGDQLLIAVAQRLESVLRAGDTVARLGGDEFTILCVGLSDEREAVEIAARVAQVIESPFAIADSELVVTTSIGIAIATVVHERASELVRDADVAMYRAKERGKARYELFDEGMRARASERLSTENALRRAIERDELRILYQPKLRLDSDTIDSVEALARWQHPERGLLSPLEFIPLAEETGLIVPVGAWVLREACRQRARWETQLPELALPDMCVNLSARQLAHPDLLAVVSRALAEADLDPGTLTLEITESVLMADAEAALATLRELKDLGVSLSVDDFGTGYSSLSYLMRFPVDVLKVDRSFVNGLGQGDESDALIGGIVEMAHALGLTVVAEGVETAEQLRDVRVLGCDLAQGFYFARPQSSDALSRLLAEHQARPREDLLTPAPATSVRP